MDITVAIPTFKGENRIPQVLDRLKAQITNEITWEILVVDNGSSKSNNSANIIKEYQDFFTNVPVRYCQEEKQGLVFAREKAICEAQGKYVGFLDDDNLPAPTWVVEAVRFGENHPQAGAYGSRIQGLFVVTPPKNFERIKRFLAVEDRGDRVHLFDPNNLRLPPGAGLVVRKRAWQECVPASTILVGRVGNSMLPGEDYEVLIRIYKGGWEVWYNPEMVIQHKISAARLEKEYLLLLAHNGGLVTSRLRAIAAIKNWHKPFIFIKGFLGSFRRWIMYLWKHQRSFGKNLEVDVERQFLWSSFLSYIYYLQGKI